MTTKIFINLKRFDVPKKYGGICPVDDPHKWVIDIIEKSIKILHTQLQDIQLIYLLPEALIISAVNKLRQYESQETRSIAIGCQGVFREDVQKDGNFGAFTTNLPAAAALNMGCSWSIIGHSEERTDKFNLLKEFQPDIETKLELIKTARLTIDKIINQEVINALKAGINVLLCVGESEDEKGSGHFKEQKTRIKAVLKSQLMLGLEGVRSKLGNRKLAIGYEPIWAIGPGKIPPGKEYISFVSRFIKETVREEFNFEPVVVYGGGLKEENAGMLSRIETIDGGLVALTRFQEEIGFEVEGLKGIIDNFMEGRDR